MGDPFMPERSIEGREKEDLGDNLVESILTMLNQHGIENEEDLSRAAASGVFSEKGVQDLRRIINALDSALEKEFPVELAEVTQLQQRLFSEARSVISKEKKSVSDIVNQAKAEAAMGLDVTKTINEAKQYISMGYDTAFDLARVQIESGKNPSDTIARIKEDLSIEPYRYRYEELAYLESQAGISPERTLDTLWDYLESIDADPWAYAMHAATEAKCGLDPSATIEAVREDEENWHNPIAVRMAFARAEAYAISHGKNEFKPDLEQDLEDAVYELKNRLVPSETLDEHQREGLIGDYFLEILKTRLIAGMETEQWQEQSIQGIERLVRKPEDRASAYLKMAEILLEAGEDAVEEIERARVTMSKSETRYLKYHLARIEAMAGMDPTDTIEDIEREISELPNDEDRQKSLANFKMEIVQVLGKHTKKP